MPKGVLKTKYHLNGGRDQLVRATIALGVSLSKNNNNHEGEKLAAAIDLINETQCRLCLIVLGDSLQFPTQAIGNSSTRTEIYDETRHEGKLWIKRNKPILSKIKVPYKLVRWNALLGHPDYAKYRRISDKLFEEDEQFHNEIWKSVIEFRERFKRHSSSDQLSSINDKEIEDASTEYLLQEGIILTKILAQKNVQFIFYPAGILNAVKAMREQFVANESPNLVQWVKYNFDRKMIQTQNQQLLKSLISYEFCEIERLEQPTPKAKLASNPLTYFKLTSHLPEVVRSASVSITKNPPNGNMSNLDYSMMKTGEVILSIQQYFMLMLAAKNGQNIDWQNVLTQIRYELQKYDQDLQLSSESSSDESESEVILSPTK